MNFLPYLGNYGFITSTYSEPEKRAVDLNGKRLYIMARNSSNNPSYTFISNIKIMYGKKYKVNFLVKKGDIGKQFGLRVQGVYPNRVDAVFDIENGNLNGVFTTGELDRGKVKIVPDKDGWFMRSLSDQTYNENVRVVFGPTNNDRNIESWQASLKGNPDLFIIPSRLQVEKLEN